jgi:hypothetical protein
LGIEGEICKADFDWEVTEFEKEKIDQGIFEDEEDQENAEILEQRPLRHQHVREARRQIDAEEREMMESIWAEEREWYESQRASNS